MTKNSKICLFVSIFALVLYSCCLNSAHADSNATQSLPDSAPAPDSTLKEGWYKTKWGMTIDEIRAVLKEDIKQIAPENRKRYKTDYTYTIPDFKIGNFSFDVSMAFDPQKGLKEVMLTKKDGPDHYACFLELEDALKKKYGNPSSSTDQDKIKMGSQMRSREWVTQHTLIRLNHIVLWFSNKAHETTNIIYQSRGDTEADKL